MNQSFGQYVRELREKAGLTQRALSQVVGFRSLAHLSDIESGKRYPARDTLPKFAAALGVSVNELESRDVRGPVEALKSLFASRPEMVGAFLQLADLAQTMDAAELVRRVRENAKVAARPTPPPPTAVAPEPPALVAEGKPMVRKGSVEKPRTDDQPSLF